MPGGRYPPPLALPALRLAGNSGAGKTTVGTALVGELQRRGYRVAALKHAGAHAAPTDVVGKDTHRYAVAGAAAVVGVFADDIVMRLAGPHDLRALSAIVAPVADLLLVEGFHDDDLDSIVIAPAGAATARAVRGRVIAYGSDTADPATTPPTIALTDTRSLADLVAAWLGSAHTDRSSRGLGE